MRNGLRNGRSLLRLLRNRWTVYSMPAYVLGFWLARHNSGAGPVAWLRGWPAPAIAPRGGRVDLGHVALYPGVHLQCSDWGRIHIGDGSFINHDTRIRAHRSIFIGQKCMVSWDVLITDSGAEFAIQSEESEASMPITIGDRCWIGAKALLLGGTTLGDGCIVAAGSVVQGAFDNGAVIAGKPARPTQDAITSPPLL